MADSRYNIRIACMDAEGDARSRIRVLSESRDGSLNPLSDTAEVTPGVKRIQFNTVAGSHQYSRSGNGGFDFQEGRLSDIPLCPDLMTLNNANNMTARNFIWVPSRARILLYIYKPEISGCYLNYQVSEGRHEAVSYIEDGSGDMFFNSLLICPRDEGIGANSPMTVNIWRTTPTNRGKITKPLGEILTLHFHTFGEPEIKITSPQRLNNLRNNSSSYPVIATDIINRGTTDGIDDVVFVCPVLSLMTTQDALDDSGLPSFTRVYVAEYATYIPVDGKPPLDSYKWTGDNPTPDAADILAGRSDTTKSYLTAMWTGVFNDRNGSVIELSGMNDKRMKWTPHNWNLNIFKDYNDHTYGEDSEGNPLSDIRLCFRAGYKYQISVRRFHGYAAGYAALRDGGKPSYWYQMRSNYPGYAVATEGGYEFFPEIESLGPSLLEYDQAANNRGWSMLAPSDAIADMEDDYKNAPFPYRTWIGPNAGDTYNGVDTYPGFSTSDTIVIDCVKTQTSLQTMITVRPASQEISADKWITFGYRRLSRAPTGFDSHKLVPNFDKSSFTKYADRMGVLHNLSDSDQYVKNESIDNSGTITSPCDVTWSGKDSTAKRCGRMYTLLVSETYRRAMQGPIAGIAQAIQDSSTVECPADGEQIGFAATKARFTVEIKLPIPGRAEYGYPVFYKAENVQFSEHSKQADNSYNVSFPAFDPSKTLGLVGYYSNYYSPVKPSPQITSAESGGFYVVASENPASRWGNTYNWVPVINAQAGNSLQATSRADATDLTINKAVVTEGRADRSMTDHNKITEVFIAGDAGDIPQAYYEDTASVGGVNYQRFMNLDKDHRITQTWGSSTTPNFSFNTDSASNPPKFISPLWIHECNVATTADNTAAYNNRHFSISPGGTSEGRGNGVQFFSMGQAVGQRGPGHLYSRVPVTQDCENGTAIVSGARMIPCRLDYNVPTVRTTHFQFFKTHLMGDLIVYVTWTNSDEFEKHVCDLQYDEETGELTGCNGEDENMAGPSVDRGSDNPITLNELTYNVGRTITIEGVSYPHTITLFDEDNNGLGRCLTANDYTSLQYQSDKTVKFVHQADNNHPKVDSGNGGGVEVPIRVRYTPCAQPDLLDDTGTVDAGGMFYSHTDNSEYPRTHKVNNIVSVAQCYSTCGSGMKRIAREYNSAQDVGAMKFAKGFGIPVGYGLYNDKCRGWYASKQNTTYDMDQYLLQVGAPGDPLPSTDFYPAVGICNSFLVVLFPHGAKSGGKECDYCNMGKNWWSKRSNYENYVINTAKPVVVSELQVPDVYKDYSSRVDLLSSVYSSDDLIPDKFINNKLSTKLDCIFDYYTLLHTNDVATYSNRASSRSNQLKPNVWYDLVVVPIFTNDEAYMVNGGRTSFYDTYVTDFNYDSSDSSAYKPGTINGQTYGGGAAQDTVYYYGSNPMVIRNFLNIASENNLGNKVVERDGRQYNCFPPDDDSTPTPDPDPGDPRYPPFDVDGCILFPNVNHKRYNSTSGLIKECPGFWLNNTFRVVIRAPHIRTEDQIDAYYGSNYNIETTLEAATVGELTPSATLPPAEACNSFLWSDVMIHFGKYTGNVKIKNADGSITDTGIAFDSADFQKEINDHMLDKDWLNARNIYTIRTNSEAWSKRVPEVEDDAERARDLITGGGLTADSEYYKNRMVEFNPNLVDAWTTEKEGFYIQVRFLNAYYSETSSLGTWTEWCGGVMDDDDDETTSSGGLVHMSPKKDVNLEYYVPIRSYSEIFTSIRNFIKGSTPGTTLTTPNKSVKIPPEYNRYFENSQVIGTGGGSPQHEPQGTGSVSVADMQSFVKHSSMKADSDIRVPTTEDIVSTQLYNTGVEAPWDPDNDILLDLGHKKTLINAGDAEETVYDRHLQYHEMLYLSYIIQNMAKLYHSNWAGQAGGEHFSSPNFEGARLTPQDTGWSRAKQFISGYDKWIWDLGPTPPTYANMSDADKKAITVADKFFRKEITVEDYDNLLITLQRLLDFTRNEYWTGKHTVDTSPSINGEYTGNSVIPVQGSQLSLDKMSTTRLNDNDGRAMLIGADIERPTSGEYDDNTDWKKVERNYIDRLWYLLKTYVIRNAE